MKSISTNLSGHRTNIALRPLVRICILNLILLTSVSSYASYEPTKTNKKNLASFSIGDSLITSIQLIDNDTHRIHHTWNRITLSVCTDTNLCYTDSFSFSAIFEARYWDIATNTYHHIDTISLAVSYNPVTGRLYNEKNTYYFQDAYKVSLIPLSYSSSPLSARVCVFNEMDAEHWWNMAYFLSDSVTFTTAPAFQNSSNEYLLTWQLKDWAEEYDLEWAWVDDYADENSYKSASDVSFNFRFSSERVTLKGNTYRINPIYEHGFLIFRIRGVGYGGTDHKHRITSAWSIPYVEKDVQYAITNYNKYTLFIDTTKSHQPYLNWQYMATYAEEGKKKEVISYFDGSLRNRQSVTKINSDTTAIVGESFYDYQGRPAISSLPVPSFSPKLTYYSNFTVNEFNLPYSKEIFDVDSTGQSCLTRTGSMDTTTGASKYYSANNPYKNISYHAYIPDALRYPFTQVEYTPDNTGRISRQGGVGLDHQLGSGHETKYFYGTPDPGELEQLFGTNVGQPEHYRKNMVQDANGQMSISYLDAKGKVIATALAGNNPSNTQSLSSNSSATFHVNLLEPMDSVYNESDLVMDRKILVSANSTQYKIKYSLQNEKFTPACIGNNTCYDCVYDLEISLKDNCGNQKMPGGVPVVKTVGRVFTNSTFDTLCHSDTTTYSFKNDAALTGSLGGTNNEYVLVTLDAGEYHLVKTLKINQAAVDYFTNKYIEQGLKSGCLISQDSFVRKAYQTIDTTTCDMDCAQCRAMIGADTSFRRQYMTALIEDSIVPTPYDTTKADSIYQIRLKSCDIYCDSIDPCRSYFITMLGHVTPGGQYATIDYFIHDSVYAGATNFTIFAIHNSSLYRHDYLDTMMARAHLERDTVLVDGNKRAITDLTATELFFNWQPDWAQILVKIHPEYCQYLECMSNKASLKYEHDMMNTDSYKAALDSGYLNPLGTDTTLFIRGIIGYNNFPFNIKDPYFVPSGRSTQRSVMKSLLEGYYISGTDTLSAWELMIGQNCSNQTTVAAFKTCTQNFFSTGIIECDDSIRLDKYWNLFRGLYLRSKHNLIDYYRDSIGTCHNNADMTRQMFFASGNKSQIVFPHEIEALVSMGFNSTNVADGATQKNKAKAGMLAACDSQCTAYASRWMQQLGNCAFSSDAYRDSFRLALTLICIGGCDMNNPLGATSVAPQYRPWMHRYIGTHYYDIYSFKDAFNAYVAEGRILTTGGVDSVRKCNIDIIDFPGNYRHDYYLRAGNPLHESAADTFITRDSIANYEIDNCACFALSSVAATWKGSVSLQSCFDSLHLYVNYLYKTKLTSLKVAVLLDACKFRPPSFGGTGAVDDCEEVVIAEELRETGGDTTKTIIPIVMKIYWPPLGDTALVTIYPNDTIVVPAIPPELSCKFAPPKTDRGCLTCNKILIDAIDFIETYGGTPDTAYVFPQLYANILNRTYGFNLSYYEFTRFLNTCDTVFNLLFGLNYKAIGMGEEDMPLFSEYITQDVPLNYPGGINSSSKLGSCACEKAMNVYLTWLDLKNKGKLTPKYATFAPFAADNHIVITEPFTADQLIDNCQSWLDIDSALTDSLVCHNEQGNFIRIACFNEANEEVSCSSETVVRTDSIFEVLIICDTFKVINYCYILNKFSPAKVCQKTLQCEDITAKLEDSLQTSIEDAEAYLNAKFSANFTILGTDYPLDPDTCTSGCTQKVYMVCSDLTEQASDYFDMLTELAMLDTLDADSMDINDVYAFRRSSFNRARYTTGVCNGGLIKKDVNTRFAGLDYEHGAIEGDSPFDYVFSLIYDSGATYCRVYMDSLNVPALDSIFSFYNVRPTSAFKNGRQDFTLTVMLKDSSEISGRGHTSCFTISNCCPPAIRLCNKPLVTQVTWESPCKASLKNAAIANGKKMYEQYMDSVRTSFRQAWTTKCLQAGRHEVMEMEYSKREYHYTLYYYDQAGNLVQTIPPAGVQFFDTAHINNTISIRNNYPDSVYQPAHTLPTVYHYNSLNQLIWQRTPDADTSEFFYDRLGRLTFSQNKKQKNGSITEEIKYSYTVYDPLGRISEVGELRSPFSITHAASRRQTFVEDSALAGTRSEITKTWYDAVKYTISNGSFAQHQLRGRVAHITYQDASGSSYQHGVHYSYDIHGNVNSMVRENVVLTAIGQQYKQIDYDYDLVSGKVNQVNYQQGGADQFYHRYDYDADNRLTQAYTSTDSVHWDRDARYFYYLHGPLARTEIGQHKVQGVDYAYTLHGWLKGVNSTTGVYRAGQDMYPDRDPGKDGWVSGANSNRNVARDVYGFTLSYYNTSTTKDYTAVNSSAAFEAELYNKDFGNASPSLYNGNIKSMVVAISKFMEGGATPMGYTYQYDQLNRLLQVDAYDNINLSTNTWNTGGSALPDYHNRFTYDANGNILTQVRRGPAAGLALDSLTYHYASNKNQLTYVDDGVSGSAYSDDIDDQSSGNYQYDEIGNLTSDAQEQIESIEWTVYGKIKRITRTTGSLKPNLEFEYSPDGHRVCKIVKPKVGSHLWNYTYYVRDAQGNIMATYDRTLEAVFDPEQTNYENVNEELVALNGASAFKTFIQTLHPLVSSTNFIDSLKQVVLDQGYELDFIKHFDPTWYLNNNFSYYSNVYNAFDNSKLITGLYNTYGENSILTNLYTHDVNGFVQYFVDQNVSDYLVALDNYDPALLYQMYQDAGGTPSTPPPGPGYMITYITGAWSNTQIATWITSNGGFILHYNILQQYLSSLDIRTLLASYSNLKTGITAQYSTNDIITAMVAYSSAYVWETLYPSLAPGTLFSDVFSHEPTNDTYDALVQYYWQLVQLVQNTNYYYSKTDYFDEIKILYGQYTYDVLVGKFITLSNQFNDVFVLSEWHMYGSSRLGIQKPVSKDSHAELVSASAGTGRELVHVEFSGSWSEYEVNYADTHYTTITTYQMSYEYYSLTRGEKNYEMTNHLGNVLVVISDKKLKTCTGDTVNYYAADVLQANDYYAFHATMVGRTYTADITNKYRFGGSNGQEKDDEIFAGAYSAEYWEYDSRLGRRWNVDPKPNPSFSLYSCFGGNPIVNMDPNGDTTTISDKRGRALEIIPDGLPNQTHFISKLEYAMYNWTHAKGSESNDDRAKGLRTRSICFIGANTLTSLQEVYLKSEKEGMERGGVLLINAKTRELYAVDLTSKDEKAGTGFRRDGSDNTVTMSEDNLSASQKAIYRQGFATFHTHVAKMNDPTVPTLPAEAITGAGLEYVKLIDYQPKLNMYGHPSVIVSKTFITIHPTLSYAPDVSPENAEFFTHPENKGITSKSSRIVLRKNFYNN